MKTLNLKQGSQEWILARSRKFTASDAPAVMGDSLYKKRNDLLREKKLGCDLEVPAELAAIYQKGHDAEDAMRPVAEKIIGDSLFPVTGLSDVDDRFLASFDGITMIEDVIFEHKYVSEKLKDMIAGNELTPAFYWQIEHQLMVSNAEKCLFMASDGTEENMHYLWYERVPGRRETLIASWDNFEKDLEDFDLSAPVDKKALRGDIVDSMPVLRYQRNGISISSNIDDVKIATERLIADSKMRLDTEQDFANQAERIKKFKSIEDEAARVKDAVLLEFSEISGLMRDLKYIAKSSRDARLDGKKAIVSRKGEIKQEALYNANKAYKEILLKANSDTALTRAGVSISGIKGDFLGALKGRTQSSYNSAIDDELANVKVKVNLQLDLIKNNLEYYDERAKNFKSSFKDLQDLVILGVDSFQAIVDKRIADAIEEHKIREEARVDAEKRVHESRQNQVNTIIEQSKRLNAIQKIKGDVNYDGELNTSAEDASKTLIGKIDIWAGEHDVSVDALKSLIRILSKSGVEL
jgi:putative phage-type endonuclease